MAEPATAAAAARLTVDLDALAHNYAVLRAQAGGALIGPVLKSDGYGLGASPLARRLWAEGARSFFVARLAEGEALRAALGPRRPSAIYVLDGMTDGAAPRLEAAGLTAVLCSPAQVAAAAAYAEATRRTLTVGVNIDTGMNRQGLTLDQARTATQAADGLRGLDVGMVMSHLGSAFEPGNPRNNRQLSAFLEAKSCFPEAQASLAASPGVFLGADYIFDLVRPGVSLLGGGPLALPDARLRAVVTLTAPILDIRQVRAGEAMGYGESVRVAAPTRVAVVAAGYSDGIVRASAGQGRAWFAGALRKILIVNMDILLIELGETAAVVGQPVELIGPNAPLDDLATAGGTVAHEILVRLSRRAERVYLGER